ncbi:transmembrane protein 106C isoform X1 [Alexandromys fortis]|uniref:transmembrane protein 106C isoform X1 n=1 Tax=Alexandromys fortis TaxID=100897 RepID=UPI0021539D1C|nr:transmembrane protein 106C isoform X1 [Microtus fortis]XP_049986797.1 transmembrane protein 106C isoform X1 [Microtus fortis]XP_049986802.1 transmembrane protein 106C isoform X1 [Microtus fortis]XP_049986812.1 transmembrane protein 106C isoform X1 [Microtus fortis]
MGSQHSSSARTFCHRKKDGNPEDLQAEREQEEAIAQFPYVEFTGRNSVTCHTCQGAGYVPAEQLNELVALIPHSDQRLRPQRTKQYVLLSVLLCLLASGLVSFFLFPHSVLVDDSGIKVVKVTFNKQDSLVVLHVTATLKIRNSNFYSVAVTNLFSQVQYMKAVAGTYMTTNVSVIPPRSEHLVNFTVKAEVGGPSSYLYFFCTVPAILVHNIMIFMRTSVQISYIGHTSQSAVETQHYVDCGANSTAV